MGHGVHKCRMAQRGHGGQRGHVGHRACRAYRAHRGHRARRCHVGDGLIGPIWVHRVPKGRTIRTYILYSLATTGTSSTLRVIAVIMPKSFVLPLQMFGLALCMELMLFDFCHKSQVKIAPSEGSWGVPSPPTVENKHMIS